VTEKTEKTEKTQKTEVEEKFTPEFHDSALGHSPSVLSVFSVLSIT
jgi:hypothetical protein